MLSTKNVNPFPTTTYRGAKYFCDRKSETNQLITNIVNGNSTTLIALRRLGKTGLIQHVLGKLPDNWKGIYLDILDTENLNQFLNNLSSAILKAVPDKQSLGKKFINFIHSLRPVISFDALTGEPKASFELKQADIESNIDAIFNFLEKQKFNILIAIDEFQQILNYPEKNTDAWLRSRIQQLKNTVFIFSGSQQHIMAELFTSAKKPFFRSTQILRLEKIDYKMYKEFIIAKFHENRKSITSDITEKLLKWSDSHTYYVQLLCNRVFSATKNEVTDEIWKDQARLLLKEQELVFFGYRKMLTKPQWQLLKALACEEEVFMPTSQKFLKKYNLGTSATVLRSLKTLLEYELIYYDFNEEGKKYYGIYDILFKRWVELI